MNTSNPTIDLSKLELLMIGGGLDVAIKEVKALNIFEETTYTPCITDEEGAAVHRTTKKTLDVVTDIILDCGGKYEIDTTVVYSCRDRVIETDGIQGVIDTLKNGVFSYQFDNERLSDDMSHNICINSNDNEVLDKIFDIKGDDFISGGEDDEGATWVLFDDITAHRGVFYLDLALNKVSNNGFSDSVLTELDRRIREAALELLSKPAR